MFRLLNKIKFHHTLMVFTPTVSLYTTYETYKNPKIMDNCLTYPFLSN